MCGICGFTGELPDNDGIVHGMMERIAHRGPDSEGAFSDGGVTLGFRRLSIIGLDDGAQPIFNEDRTKLICLNGEIYNYRELKAELEQKGHVFSTHSDVETVLHLYEEAGTGLLNRLRGMFAFVIYDIEKRLLFCARDYFGIKPFYYGFFGGNLLFGSEIKSFLAHPLFEKELNERALEHYLTFQYSVLDETFFKHVFKLAPGHYFLYEPDKAGDGAFSVNRYWKPEFSARGLYCGSERGMTLNETITAIDEAVVSSIRYHKISDVEVGAFLSSGVDSSYVAACFNGGKTGGETNGDKPGGDKTFTVGFDYDNYNEIEYAKSLSAKIGIENFSKMITREEYWDILPTIQYHMDEPLADASAVALYFVSQTASGHVKVALSGEGADEFFGGYNIYKEPLDLMPVTILPRFIRRFLGFLAGRLPFKIRGKNFFIRASKPVEERFIGNANIFSKAEREEVLKNPLGEPAAREITAPFYAEAKDCDDITKMQYIDLNLWLVGDILLKADKMSMAHSLEVRVPFLDKEVFGTASRLPTDFRVNKTGTKYAFRAAARRHLPEEVANKKKLGFPVPIRIWLREDKYYNIVKEAFCSSAADKYFRREKLIALIERHRAGREDNSRKIWVIYMFLVWYGVFFEDVPVLSARTPGTGA